MCGGNEHAPLEVRAVRELVQQPRELLLRRRQAHVDQVVALLDRPLEAAEQDGSAPRVAGAEHPDAVELALGCDRAHDPGTRRPVPAQVTLVVLLHDPLAAPPATDRDCPLELPNHRMPPLDAAVEDADANTRSLGVPPGPLACDAFRPLVAQPDLVDGVRGQAPRRNRLMRFVGVRGGGHGRRQNSFWSFIAAPMSPLILTLPVMYAVVGFCSPDTSFWNVSSEVEIVVSGSASPSCVTVTFPSR